MSDASAICKHRKTLFSKSANHRILNDNGYKMADISKILHSSTALIFIVFDFFSILPFLCVKIQMFEKICERNRFLTLMQMSIDPWIAPDEQLKVKAAWSSKLLPPAQYKKISRRSSRINDFPFVDCPLGMASPISSANKRKASFDKRKFLLKYERNC